MAADDMHYLLKEVSAMNRKLQNIPIAVFVSLMLAASFACSADAGVYRFNGSLFERVAGSLSQISAGADGAVWGVDGSNQVFRMAPNSGLFAQVP